MTPLLACHSLLTIPCLHSTHCSSRTHAYTHAYPDAREHSQTRTEYSRTRTDILRPKVAPSTDQLCSTRTRTHSEMPTCAALPSARLSRCRPMLSWVRSGGEGELSDGLGLLASCGCPARCGGAGRVLAPPAGQGRGASETTCTSLVFVQLQIKGAGWLTSRHRVARLLRWSWPPSPCTSFPCH